MLSSNAQLTPPAPQIVTQLPSSPHVVVTGRQLHDSIGANTHQNFYGLPSSHSNWSHVIAKLQELGIKNIRDAISDWTQSGSASGVNAAQMQDYQAAASAGIRLALTSGPVHPGDSWPVSPCTYPNDKPGPAFQQVTNGGYWGSVRMIGWPNEPNNNSSDPNWATNTPQWGRAIYAIGQAQAVPVYGPALVDPLNNASKLGDQSVYMDFGDIHDYMGIGPGGTPLHPPLSNGNSPYDSVQTNIERMVPVSGGRPVVCTEFGYPVPEWATAAQQASWILRQWFIHLRKGISVSYVYELFDDHASTSYIQDHFGICYADGSNKPAATAIQNVLAQIPATAPNIVAPLSFTFDAANDLSDVEYLDVALGDGTHSLILWRDGMVSDTKTLTVVAPGCFYPACVDVGADPVIVSWLR